MVDLADIGLKLESRAGMVNILHDVGLTVPRGQIAAVVGPSGSGKSTLMMLIGGLERPTEGTIRVAGKDLKTLDEDALALFRRDHVGIVFQNFHLVPTMTALENVAIPMELAGRRDAMERAQKQLTAVGLDHRLDHYPGQLSGGEQQRVALARAFAGEPDLVLADEPTGNLDGATGERIIHLMFDLSRARGATLLLVTHDRELAARCDRQISLADGTIVGDTVTARPELKASA